MKRLMRWGEMAGLSLKDAADRIGKSKATLWRAVKAGKLSATPDEAGAYRVDPAELARAFPPEAVSSAPLKQPETLSEATETALLAVKLAAAEAMVAELREDRNRWRDQAERLALAPPKPANSRRGLFGLFGRG